MDLEVLNKTFEISETPGISNTDPRFIDVATMIQSGKYKEAASLSQEIIEENIYDIRIICYFFYGVFDEQGVGALGDIFKLLIMIFQENRDAVGPVKNREKQVKNSLQWFLKQTIKILENEEKKEGDKWKHWLNEVSADTVEEALELNDTLIRVVGPVLEEHSGPIVDGLSKIKGWLRPFHRLVYKEPELEPDEEDEEIEATYEEEVDDEDDEIFDDGEITTERTQSSPGLGSTAEVFDSASYPMQMLLRKIDAFEQVIKKKKLHMAAIIAHDIHHIIANFDPTRYFPEIFVKFVLQFALNAVKLTEFQKYRDTIEWQAMERLYKVDIDSFVQFDGDIEFKTYETESLPDQEHDEPTKDAYEEDDEIHGDMDDENEDW